MTVAKRRERRQAAGDARILERYLADMDVPVSLDALSAELRRSRKIGRVSSARLIAALRQVEDLAVLVMGRAP